MHLHNAIVTFSKTYIRKQPESFFKLHDLNRDGILDRSELEAIYGLHHETSKSKSGNDEEHERKTNEILKKVLDILDHNHDGVVTKTEFVSAGREGLPEFGENEGLGHHYDDEGEYFLVSEREIGAPSRCGSGGVRSTPLDANKPERPIGASFPCRKAKHR